MNVSDIAREVGIAPSAVRFYERRGILPQAARGPNGYREYSEEDLCRVQVVASLRRLGLELTEAGRLAELCASGQCDAMSRDLLPLVASQRAEIVRSRAELDALDRQLARLEAALIAEQPDPDLCLTKGGDDSDRSRLRLGVSVPDSVPARRPLLSR